ncbi:MAG: pilus (MSHA type) biogenesis protein MshL [Gammaproteobacteria bacterium]|nr:pilus (MSHA type) biogenesis protein MshL [Gammaproteobacteria bacterium]
MKHYFVFKILIVALTIFLAACNSTPKKSDEQNTKAKKRGPEAYIAEALTVDKKVDSEIPGAPPAAVQDAMLPGYVVSDSNKTAGIKKLEQERFDINVAKLPAKTFFMSLIQDSSINMIVHPDVVGVITLDLKRISIPELMEIVREVYGYEYERQGNSYMVLPARLQSKIFYVNYLNIDRRGESNMRVTSGQLADTNNNGSSNNSSNRNDSSSAQAFESTKLRTENKMDFWGNLEASLRSIIGESAGRSVVTNAQAGLVVVRALPAELRDVGRFLATANTSLHRQVILEAKIIEVELSETHQAGINWVALNQSGSTNRTASQIELVNGNSEFYDNSLASTLPGALGSDIIKGFGNVFTYAVTGNDFEVILRLLDTQGTANVLSSPRISTVNNQKAVIKVGSDEYFVTEVKSTTTTGTSTTTTPEITLTPFFSGIALDVTPQIDENGDVILHVHPSVSEVKDQIKQITLANQTQVLPLAFSTVRESDSIIKAKNQQIVVIGGLMKDYTIKNEGGLPFLKDLPLIGHLFKHTQSIKKRNELVILLKPTVIDDGANEVWDNDREQVKQRISNFR